MQSLNFYKALSSLDLSRDVFIHPTNSCYGIWGSIYSEKVYNKIYKLKWRPSSKPFFITVQDIHMLQKIWVYDPRIDDYLVKFPHKTFTFILPRIDNLPSYINPWFDTVGVQIAWWPLQEIFNYIDSPIFWTSANISWQDPIYTSKGIQDTFWDESDIIFLDGWDLEKTPASTIIDLTKKEPKTLRWKLW